MKQAVLAASTAACLVLGGCSTYALPKYSADAPTVSALRKLAPAKVSLGPISGESAVLPGITCRGVGPVKPPDGLTFGEYVRGALRSELQMADLYDEKSPVQLSGVLTGVDFSSGMTDAIWRMKLDLSSTTGAKLTSTAAYKFEGSFVGEVACNQTAQAGMGAVQSLMAASVKDARFADLVKPR